MYTHEGLSIVGKLLHKTGSLLMVVLESVNYPSVLRESVVKRYNTSI